MPSIESSGFPLVFKSQAGLPHLPDEGRLLTVVRSLEGMQKEALVRVASSARTWRVVSDEGPYLNGTDLAPFPLAFFTAGMQFSLLSQILQLALGERLSLDRLEVVQDNHYSMEGSFLRGDAVGGGMPAEVSLKVESDAAPGRIERIVRLAWERFPAHAVMRDRLENTFSLDLNGRSVHLRDLPPSPRRRRPHLLRSFESISPIGDGSYLPQIIRKVGPAQVVHGVEGGAGSSLQAEQKRRLHIHGEARTIDGFLMETTIRLLKPIGSTFSLFSDEIEQAGGTEKAPPPLAYLSAGVGFCYLTQLGRYAQIVGKKLGSYGIIQENGFRLEGEPAASVARAEPFDTHVFLDAELSDEDARRIVRIGERTCFLHASMRQTLHCKLRFELNGQEGIVA